MNLDKLSTMVGSVTLTLLAAACGDLVSGSHTSNVAYTRSGDLAAFNEHAMVLYTGDLSQERRSVSYGFEATTEGEAAAYRKVCSGGTVAAVVSDVTDALASTRRITFIAVPGGEHLGAIDVQMMASLELSPTCEYVAYHGTQGCTPITAGGGFTCDPTTLSVHRVIGGARLWQAPADHTTPFTFSADGARLLGMGSSDASTTSEHLRAWDVASGELRLDVPVVTHTAGQLAALQDGSGLVASSILADGRYGLAILSLEDGHVLREVVQDDAYWNVIDVAVSPDGAWYLGTSLTRGESRMDGVVELWRSDGTLVRTTLLEANAVAFAPDSLSFAALNMDGEILVYRVEDGALIARRAADGEYF